MKKSIYNRFIPNKGDQFMTSILWDSQFLKDFSQELLHNTTIQFWDEDINGDVDDFKSSHYKRMLNKFFPAMGVKNLQLGTTDKGRPTSTLVFTRGNRVEQIDPLTLKQVCFKLFNFMGIKGEQIRNNFYKERVFNKDELSLIPDLEGKKVFKDNALSAYRFFQNGFVEITSNGVSPIKPYTDIPDDYVIWNSSVIPKNYEDTITKEVLEEKLSNIIANGIHPETGDLIYQKNERVELYQEFKKKVDSFEGKNPDTHFKDFVENLSRDEEGDVDEELLKRLEIAIGYLCHRYTSSNKRQYVLLVDRFYDGLTTDVANGGNGKSLLINTLGTLMNLTILNGKEIKKNASSFKLAEVTTATEIVHFDDAHQKFDADRLNPLVTGNFHIERKYENPFSIPAQDAPKIAITSNHPIEGKGNTYKRRQFICEVGHFYRLQDEEFGLTPRELHGMKDFPLPSGNLNTEGEPFSWDKDDWNEFYRYVFRCIQRYLTEGLPSGGESHYYNRAKIVQEIGDEEITQYLIDKIQSLEIGREYFNEEIYKDLQDTFPDQLENVSTMSMYGWLCSIGKLCKLYVNRHRGGRQDNQRLNEERWERYVSVGLEGWINKDGRQRKNPKGIPSGEQDRVGVFKISSMKDITSMVSKPDFSSNTEDKVTTDEPKKGRRIPKKKVVKDKSPVNLEDFSS